MVNLVAASRDSFDIVTSFPHEVKEVSHFWIPLSDGARLAARMWLPADAETHPVPAVVEYIPYRQGDFTAPRDRVVHPWFAGHGYAAIRIDIRGSGNSEGLPLDEYVKQEQDDALEALAWIAEQSWCDGHTGLIGISWGGFAALQIAARRPPSLGAIITVCSTDDRYADDVHYMGGCLLSNNITWGSCMFAYMCRPPDPAIVGEGWREQWLARIDGAPLTLATWLEHPTRDDYWRHGSVREDYSRIEAAVYAVGGWTDGYSNAIPRLLAGLECPKRGLIGPWAHGYPHIARPGPNIGFLDDAVRWWDRWLKGERNGIDEEPELIAWMQSPRPPLPECESIGGRWVAESVWPSDDVVAELRYLNIDGLGEEEGAACDLEFSSPTDSGWRAGEWTPHGIGPELALDQREDDAGGLVFESSPLVKPLEILGAPIAGLVVSSDQPDALVCVRLSSVAPDGAVSRVSYALANLTHRDGDEEPSPLEPGRWYSVRVQLNDVAQCFPLGSRIRVSVSSACWPMAWPSPRRARLGLRTGVSWFELPHRVGAGSDAGLRELARAAIPQSEPVTWLRPVSRGRQVVTDIPSGKTTLVYTKDDGAYRLEDSLIEADAKGTETHWIVRDDPLSAGSEVAWRFEHRRAEWRTAVESRITQTATDTHFLVTARADAFEGDRRIHSVVQSRKIARRFI